MLQDQWRGPSPYRQPIRFDAVVKVIGRDKPGSASHVFHNPVRISWKVPADVTRDQPGVLVISAARRRTHDKGKGFVFVEFLRLGIESETYYNGCDES